MDNDIKLEREKKKDSEKVQFPKTFLVPKLSLSLKINEKSFIKKRFFLEEYINKFPNRSNLMESVTFSNLSQALVENACSMVK